MGRKENIALYGFEINIQQRRKLNGIWGDGIVFRNTAFAYTASQLFKFLIIAFDPFLGTLISNNAIRPMSLFGATKEAKQFLPGFKEQVRSLDEG